MGDLREARVVLLEARMASELANLVERQGGRATSVPAVREAGLPCGPQEIRVLQELAAGDFSVAIFLTGVGVKALFTEAERQDCLAALHSSLKRMTVVCRGPKPAAVLKAHSLPITMSARTPYTTSELQEALAGLQLQGARVALLHYGERNAPLASWLHGRGARLEELCLYEWQLPADLGPLRDLVGEIIAGRVDAIAFTSQIQVRHLYQMAAEQGRSEELTQALNRRTIVASVGPTCTAALRQIGVMPHVEPEHPKMGAMVLTLSRYWTAHHRVIRSIANGNGE
jgi:uroporphyrinogen-III synthase